MYDIYIDKSGSTNISLYVIEPYIYQYLSSNIL